MVLIHLACLGLGTEHHAVERSLVEPFDALVQNDGRCILDAARDGDRGGDTEPHDHDREGDLGDDHEGGHLVALHALGRLAEDGLERDAGKGKVHAGEANGHEHDHPDGTGLDAGHEGEELGDEQGERREGGEREQGDDGERCRDGSDLDDGLDLVQVAGVVDVLDVTGHAEGERLRETVEDAVQQAGGDTERTTDTQAQRDHADVVDGGVREAALDHMIPVSILHKDLVLLQMRRQLLPVQIACTSIYGQANTPRWLPSLPSRWMVP